MDAYVQVPNPGDYDIKTSIIRYDETGQVIKLGDGDWQHTTAPNPLAPKQPASGPILLSESIEVESRRWRTVVGWRIPKGFFGELRAINIQLTGDCEVRVILPSHPSKTVKADTTLSWSTAVLLHSGETAMVRARSGLGNQGTAQVIIQGELHAIPVAGVATEKKPRKAPEKKPREETEEPLRSLGEMIEEMKKREEVPV